ncbi:MAG TPA: hypothetical protein VM029_04790 [Opitutaceae bacterium]|nr:hypothetical protein [Opitutaceae bacterium]
MRRLQIRIARCADRLARQEKNASPPRSLCENMQLWMQAECSILDDVGQVADLA